MDAGAVLRLVRARMRLSQRELAKRAGASRSALSAYEAGAQSPTVRQLNALLAACNLQLTWNLTRLAVPLEEQVDAVLDGSPVLDTDDVCQLAMSLREHGAAWAADAETALALHGFSVSGDLSGAVVYNDAFERWRRAVQLRTIDRWGCRTIWGTERREDLEASLARGTALAAPLLLLNLRLVDELPPCAEQTVVGSRTGRSEVVPVLPLTAVLDAHPRWSEVILAAVARVRDEPHR